MAVKNQENDIHVTRQEFHSFTNHIEQRFQHVDVAIRDVSAALKDIAEKVGTLNKPKYDILISVITVIIIMVGMGSTLCYTFIKSSDERTDLRFQALESSSNRRTMNDQHNHDMLYRYDMEQIRNSIVDNSINIEKLKTELSHHNDLQSLNVKYSELTIRNDELLNSIIKRLDENK